MGGGNTNVVGGSGGGIPREGKCKCCNTMNGGFKLPKVINVKKHTQWKKRLYVRLK
jgi:hypothetical protein